MSNVYSPQLLPISLNIAASSVVNVYTNILVEIVKIAGLLKTYSDCSARSASFHESWDRILEIKVNAGL